MKLMKHYLILFLLSCVLLVGCKPKDSYFQAQIEKTLKASPETSGVTIKVNKGTATLSGDVVNNAAREKAYRSAWDVNGIKKVENHIIITKPVTTPPVQVNNDNTLINGVKDATKDFPTVNANVNDGIITLTGSIKRSNLQSLMMSLNTLKPKKIEDRLTIK